MKDYVNRFGVGVLYDGLDLKGKIYFKCCACMSVHADILSWANYPVNSTQIVPDPQDADTIIVLGCQVTDLAVLNDLRTLEGLIDLYPEKKFFVGGCLAKRFDIPLPDECKRLNNLRIDRQPIPSIQNLIDFAPPFWVENWCGDSTNELEDGKLFRNDYPLRIGVGCRGNCAYCTIKDTRGSFYELFPTDYTLRNEFISNEKDIVLIADNPSPELISEWCAKAEAFSKRISLRNLEPNTVVRAFPAIKSLAEKGLLKILHCPIQSPNQKVLEDMNRAFKPTFEFMELCSTLKDHGVILATNIIIDYKHFPNPTGLEKIFDYISWNPYWNGIFDIDRAKERFVHYLPWTKEVF